MLDLVHKSCSVVSSKRMQQWAASDAYQAGAPSMSIFFDEYLGDLETQDTFLSSSSKSNSNDP